MSIDRINIQTAGFTLRAANIRGGQLRDLVDALRRAGGASLPAPAPALGGGPPAPGAIRSPADQFPQVAPSSADSADASDAASGFAPGGADQLRSLDTNGMMRLIVELLERLLQAIFQMTGQGAGSSGGAQGSDAGGDAGTGCGGATGGPGGAGGPTTCGGGAGMPAPSPTTAPPGPTGQTGTPPPGTTPPRNPSTGGACGSGGARARPRRRSSLVRKILTEIGKGAIKHGPSLVPGGAAIKQGAGLASRLGRRSHPAPQPSGGPFPMPPTSGSPIPIRPNASSLGGGTFEERLFAFLSGKVRESESELDGAMQQTEGGGGGDSRTLASQKVQQLVQKRSELVEAMTNTLKSVHETSMSVTRNIK